MSLPGVSAMAEPTGSFETRKATGPAIEVDCSGWVDTSVGDWAVGSFVTRTATGPPIEVDCSGWGREPVGCLELLVAADADTTDDTIAAFTQRIVKLIAALDPALQLTYDIDRTRADNGDVRVVLRPGALPADVDRRVEAVLATVNGWLVAQMKDVPAFRLESRRKAG